MAESKIKTIKCKQDGCTASTDGKCLEGLELNACSHCSIIEEDIKEEIIDPDNEFDIPEKEFFNVHTGEALNLDETFIVTSSSMTRLIILAGLSGAGKTTMIASLFDLFQRNSSFMGYDFAGSKTLIGFEKRCHDSRIKSKRNKADTERTKLLPPSFLHLKVKKEYDTTDMLFTDISGELFNNLSNSTAECEKFELAKRADHFVLFIDSDKLSDQTQKQIVKRRSINILKSLIEAKMLTSDTYIEIVFSRWDMLDQKTNKEIHELFLKSVEDDINKIFSEHYKNISFFKIACRSINIELYPFGYGLEKLFPNWVEKSPFINNRLKDNEIQEPINSSREFSKFKYL